MSTLEGAILGLLALMIGFTFAMALARFESRRLTLHRATVQHSANWESDYVDTRLLWRAPDPANKEVLESI